MATISLPAPATRRAPRATVRPSYDRTLVLERPVVASASVPASPIRLTRRGRRLARTAVIALALLLAPTLTTTALAQRSSTLTPDQVAKRWATEKELQSVAVVERKVLVTMRDGVRLATDVYRPKDAKGKVPTVWVRTPYNFNFWDVANGVPSDMTQALTAVKRGYAYVVQNERGHYFSEGHYEILGAPVTDGEDALSWIALQPWSNGKVGTVGCSSTAEYQMAVAATGLPPSKRSVTWLLVSGSRNGAAPDLRSAAMRCRILWL